MKINLMILFRNFLRKIHLNLTVLLHLYRMVVGLVRGFLCDWHVFPGPAQVLPRYISPFKHVCLVIWNFEILFD